jgi:cell shape-determining protein MreC
MVVALTIVIFLVLLVLFVFARLEQKAKMSEMQEVINEQKEQITLLLKRTTPKELTVEQEEFKKTLELKWKTAMDKLENNLRKQIEEDGGQLKKEVEKFKKDFGTKLTQEYQKAVESIAFNTVEYKKTITKKRKDFSRKHKATTAQKEHRSIDDE